MLTGFLDGLPQFVDGESCDDISSILWATGYKNDFGWLPAAALNENGQPLQTRGAAHNIPGLYFVGQRFMYRADSSNIAGVSRDAAHIAGLIAQQIAPRK